MNTHAATVDNTKNESSSFSDKEMQVYHKDQRNNEENSHNNGKAEE